MKEHFGRKVLLLDQEEDLELGDESGKLVFLNHINKQTKIPRNNKRKSINPVIVMEHFMKLL